MEVSLQAGPKEMSKVWIGAGFPMGWPSEVVELFALLNPLNFDMNLMLIDCSILQGARCVSLGAVVGWVHLSVHCLVHWLVYWLVRWLENTTAHSNDSSGFNARIQQ